MKRYVAILLSVILVLAFFVGCDASNSIFKKIPDYPVTVKNVTIEQKPLSIGSLSPTITKILLDLGYEDQIVAYSSEDTLPEIDIDESTSSDTQKREIGQIGNVLSPDMEMIGKLKPEVIFTTSPFTKVQMDKLAEVNIKVVILATPVTIDELCENVKAIITIMSGNNEVEVLGASITEEIKRQLAYIGSKAPADKKKVLYVKSLNPLIIATGDTYESTLLSLVCTNAADSYKNYTVSEEDIQNIDFDVLLYSDCINSEDLSSSKVFSENSLLDGKELIAVDDSLFSNCSIDVSESLKKAIEPIYKDIDFDEPEVSSAQE